MSSRSEKMKSHLFLKGFNEKVRYERKGSNDMRVIPSQKRGPHASKLMKQLQIVQADMIAARAIQEKAGFSQDFGLQIEFESFPDIGWFIANHSFDVRTGIELLSTRVEGPITYVRVFVPDGKLSFFEKKINDYLDYKVDRNGKPLDNRKYIDTIKNIRTATLKALWTDSEETFPTNPNTPIWWEVWLPVRKNRMRVFSDMIKQARVQGMSTLDYSISFPERTVTLIKATRTQMENSLNLLNMIAELRSVKDTAEFFDTLSLKEQIEWKDDLLRRVNIIEPHAETAYVCILDTGVTRGHPLLAQVLNSKNMDSVEPSWGVDDKIGHGTNMAGLAIWGDLYEALLKSETITIYHHLESVKLLSKDGGNEGESRFHGFLTREAVSRAEVTAPYRNRVFQLAITAGDGCDQGRPSAWSSMIDELCYGDDPLSGRLFIVSAGNIREPSKWQQYPNSNSISSVQDPAQAWNALTVGAYTKMTTIDEDIAADYRPVAGTGELSPFSSTSMSWDTTQWPIKPEVVMEGGNLAIDALGPVQSASLSLLTTHHKPMDKLFTTANATSAASAQVSRLAAQILTEYPTLNPATVRGLIVHSAQWTDEMKTQFLGNIEKAQKGDYARLVRHCGFGVPDLQRSLWSVSNSLTLIIEDSLKPFTKVSSVKYKEMNFYALPWPIKELNELGSQPVEMRLTLSYFISPNPSNRARTCFRYESFGLRFDVKGPLESNQQFKSRITKSIALEETDTIASDNSYTKNWCLGTQARHKGSIHSDIWRGSAIELANCGLIAVFPRVGWWKTRKQLKQYDNIANYSLLVSIHVPSVNVDLYTAIKKQIDIKISNQVSI